MSDKPPQAKQGVPLARYTWLAALSALAAFAAVYVTLGGPDNAPPAVPGGKTADEPSAKPAGSGLNPLSTGSMTTFVFKPQPEALPEIRFLNGNGEEVSLKDWHGKVVLLNVWATWCAPCREEMPALDRLQAELGSDKFQVVALAVDKSGLDGARKFLADIKVGKLELFADPTARDGLALKVFGMPTSILIDREGREIGRLIGPAAWDSAEAKRLIEAQL
jgi:thiol-disulfide isomerase/thioredoxin